MKRKRLIIASFASVILVCCGLASCLAARDSADNEREPTAVSLATVEETTVEGEDEATATKATEDDPPTESPTETLIATTRPTNTATATKRPTNTPVPTVTLMPQVRITASSVNLRAGPGANYDVIETAVADEVLFVIASNQAGDWYNVVLADDTRAWIAGTAVEMVDAFDVNVARTIPAPPTIAATSPPLPTNTTVPLATSTSPPLPTNTSAPLPTAPLPTATEPPASGGCTCSGDTLNCSDFGTHAAAQACFDFCVAQGAGDIHGLDQNNDGNACESLP